MNSVSRVKALCKERKIPIYKLEKDLGYANGYIGQLKKGTFPDTRLVEIARYLNVSPQYLLYGTLDESELNTVSRKEKEPTPGSEGEFNVLRIAGRDGSYVERKLTDDQMAALKSLLDQLPEADF